MTLMDPIGDMFTRIRNGQLRLLTKVQMPSSNFRLKVLEVLKNEGFISSYHIEKKDNNKISLVVDVKYYEGKPIITEIKVTINTVTIKLPPENSTRTAENFKPKPDKIIPPIIIPKLPIAAPAAALLWAPLIRPTKTSLGPIAVSLFLHDKTKVETIPQKAP